MAKKLEKGKCPRCGKSLRYLGEKVNGDDTVGDEVDCSCGFAGHEWHRLEFDGFTDEQGVPIETE